MGKPITLLERLCAHILSFGAQSIEVKHDDASFLVFAIDAGVPEKIADFASSSFEGKELSENLDAVAKKPLRAAIGGQVYILSVATGSDKNSFAVSIDPAPKLDPEAAPSFTAKQGQYLALIYNYTKMNRQAPSESDMERYFRVSPPAIHDMIKTLELKGFIERTPGKGRSIRLLVKPEHLPRL